MKGTDPPACRMHRGMSERPGALVSLATHGRFVPQSLIDDVRRLAEDPESVALNHELRLLKARSDELLRGIDANVPHSGAWRDAERYWKTATEGGDPTARAAAMAKLGELFTAGADKHEAWRELEKNFDLQRSLAEAITRREQALEQFMTRKEAVAFGAAIMDVLTRYIPDPTTRQMAISETASIFQRRTAGTTGRR